jgi:5'-deoxynucleotidase YfbR-like HD superfamily hydrolase
MQKQNLPSPEFDDTRLLPILAWLLGQLMHDLHELVVRDLRDLLKGVR